jgi:hypothetical protein
MRRRATGILLGTGLLASMGLSVGAVPAAAATQASTGQERPVVLQLREPLSVSDAVQLINSVGARPAEFVARYRVDGQTSTAGYTLDAAQQSISAGAVTQGLRTAVAAAMGKARENERLSAAAKARWVRDHSQAVEALDGSRPVIHKIRAHASDSIVKRLRAQEVVESAALGPSTKPKSSTRSVSAETAAAAGGVPYWPYTGFIETNCCWGSGNRGVYQSMVWTQARLNALKNARGDPSNVGYEADAIYFNGDGATYLEDTISWTTNLPEAYLDSQFGDSQDFKIRTIGTADANQMVLNASNPVTGAAEASYFTLIVSEDGSASTDTATVKGTVSHRVPSACHEPWCIFDQEDIPSHYFIPNQGHSVPGRTPYPCEAAVEGYCDPTLGGPPVLLSIELGGQQRSFTFQGTTGAQISLGLTDSTFTQPLTVEVLRPDGARLDSISLNGSSAKDLDLPKLPTTGTYRVRLIPSGSDIGWITITVSSAVAGTVAVNGASTTATVSRIGQDAYIDFQGTAGQLLSLATTNNTYTDYMDVIVLRPDGNRLDSITLNGISEFDLPKLPTTGTYRIRLDPLLRGSSVGTGSVALTLSAAVTGTMSIGSSTTMTTTRPGQDAYIDFQGTAGQLLRLAFSLNSMAHQINVTVSNPSGSTLKSSQIIISGSIDLPALPTTGTYRIRLDPDLFPSQGQGSVVVALSSR